MARDAVSDIADIIADVIGGPVTHNDIDADAWPRWRTSSRSPSVRRLPWR
jgi:hypothetical protein